jgi:hypothetical protein
MNILTKTFGGRIVCRPDTTWEKDNEDFYPPEFVEALSFAPAFFVHILKPGRSIAKKFVGRYYDGVGFGILLYPENMITDEPESYAQALCLDKISYLPAPYLTPAEYNSIAPCSQLSQDSKQTQAAEEFILMKNEYEIFRCHVPSIVIVEDAIVEASRLAYLRTGDIVAVELAAREPLMQSTDGRAAITSKSVGTPLNFSIIF